MSTRHHNRPELERTDAETIGELRMRELQEAMEISLRSIEQMVGPEQDAMQAQVEAAQQQSLITPSAAHPAAQYPEAVSDLAKRMAVSSDQYSFNNPLFDDGQRAA